MTTAGNVGDFGKAREQSSCQELCCGVYPCGPRDWSPATPQNRTQAVPAVQVRTAPTPWRASPGSLTFVTSRMAVMCSLHLYRLPVEVEPVWRHTPGRHLSAAYRASDGELPCHRVRRSARESLEIRVTDSHAEGNESRMGRLTLRCRGSPGPSAVPVGTCFGPHPHPTLKRWAILGSASGTGIWRSLLRRWPVQKLVALTMKTRVRGGMSAQHKDADPNGPPVRYADVSTKMLTLTVARPIGSIRNLRLHKFGQLPQ